MYEKTIVFYFTIILCLLSADGNAVACSAFSLVNDEYIVMGKSYDWGSGEGYVMVNNRNVNKKRHIANSEPPLAWTSRYGSVTFNQYGKEYPLGGMNEAGMVVEVLLLHDTQYPVPDKRMGIDVMGWVQYQLDNSATIYDVIETGSKIRIIQREPPLHFLICDSSGNTMVVEFLNKNAVFYNDSSLPYACVTNSRYNESLTYLRKHKGFGGNKEVNYYSGESLNRFAILADMTNKYTKLKSMRYSVTDYAFSVLNRVRDSECTRFQIVYDIKKRAIFFRSRRSSEIKTLRLEKFDYHKGSDNIMININTKYRGNIETKFTAYDFKPTKQSALNAIRETGARNYYSVETFSKLLDLNHK